MGADIIVVNYTRAMPSLVKSTNMPSERALELGAFLSKPEFQVYVTGPRMR